jgi:hypothetical protein
MYNHVVVIMFLYYVVAVSGIVRLTPLLLRQAIVVRLFPLMLSLLVFLPSIFLFLGKSSSNFGKTAIDVVVVANLLFIFYTFFLLHLFFL